MKIKRIIQITTTVQAWEKSRSEHHRKAEQMFSNGADEVFIVGAGHTLAFFPNIETLRTIIKHGDFPTNSAPTGRGYGDSNADAPGASQAKETTH